MNTTLTKKGKTAFLSIYYEKLNQLRFFFKKQTTFHHSVWPLALSILLATTSSLSAQINVQPVRTTAVYNIGEPIAFQVSSNSSGTVTYEINYDNNLTPIETGSLNLIANVPQDINFTLSEPGLVFCKVTQWNNSVFAAASCAPLDIEPLEAEPADYDAFWNSQKADLAAIPMDAQVSFYQDHPYGTSYRVNLANVEGRRIYGYLTVPDGPGPFPAIISMPPAGNTANLVKPQDYMAERAGVLAFSLSVFDSPLNQVDPEGYEPNDITDPEGIYYRYAILGAMRVIDYLETRNDYDGENMGVVGVSQGGGMSILVGGLDSRVKLIANSNPSHCQHTAYKYNKASPYPFYLKSANEEFSSPSDFEQIVQATKYYDAAFAARRYNGPNLTITNYRDEVVPAASVYAALSQMSGQKVIMHSRELDHNTHPEQYWTGRFDFFRKHFPSTLQTAPWPWNPTTTGYYADAGSPINTTAGNPTTLNGTVELNDSPTNLPVEWRLVSGPGTVNFADENDANTTATFSNNGTYTLAFIAYDNTSLAGEAKFYSIIDHLSVNVSTGGGGSSNLVIACPSDRVVTLAENELTTSVTWPNPTAFTTCPSGNTNVTQIGGLPRSSSFSEGTYSITYQASDDCGNTETCSFNITVEATTPVNNVNYCTSTATSPWVQWIAGVNFENINQSSSKTTYSDFTNISTSVSQNETYPITLNPGFSFTVFEEYWTVWIDFNQDGDFEDANEEVLRQNSTTTITENISIPANALLGTTRMRVSMKKGSFASSCETINEGEVEDYSLIIMEGTVIGDTTPPTVVLTTPSLDVDGSFVVTATFSEAVSGLTENDFVINNGTVLSLNGNDEVFTLLVSPFAFGEIPIRLAANTVVDAAGNPNLISNQLTINYNEIVVNPADYCESTSNAPWVEWIAGVNLENINNFSGKAPYSDFTSLSTTIAQNGSYPMTLTPGFSFTVFEEYWTVWIDFNQDGDFEDANEQVIQSNSMGTITENISVPPNAILGPTRMRVSMKKNNFSTPCETFNEGEVEDYTIIITEAVIEEDTTPPTVMLSTPNNEVYGDFAVTVIFSEPITGLTITDFNISNGTASNLNGNGTEYMFLVSPNNFGAISIQLPTNSVVDAANNENTVSNELMINYIQVANLVVTCNNNITVTAASGESNATVTWNEPTASSSCTIGQPTIEQIAGAANGSLFQIGITTITYLVSDGCSNENTCTFEVNVQEGSPPLEYCESMGTSPWLEWISNVSFGDIDNTSFKNSYGDFTNLSTSLETNQSYPVTLTPDFSFTVYDEYWSIWIDFNQDSDFDDANELVLQMNGMDAIEGNIVIPSDALTGSTRMRISMQKGSFATPCEVFSFGEVEDYTVEIVEGTTIEDVTAPNVVLSTASTNVENSFEVFVNFDEAVENLSLSDFTISNGSAFGFSGLDNSYRFVVTPEAEGIVRIFLPAARTNDASGNLNTESNLLEVNYSSSTTTGNCPTVDLFPLDWTSVSGNNNLIYFSNHGTASYTNTNGSWKGTELRFSDIDINPSSSDFFELNITISNYTATNHQLQLYLANGNNRTPLIDFSTFALEGSQTFTVDLDNYDRFVIGGEGINNGVSFATVELDELTLNCVDALQESASNETHLNSQQNHQAMTNKVDFGINVDAAVAIFPNPLTDYLQLSSHAKNQIEEVQIFNLQGQLLKQFSGLSASHLRLILHDLNTGVYWCKIETEEGIVMEKLLKM